MSNNRFISEFPLPEGQEQELLIILMEECAEVIQRASKALRFGLDEIQPGQEYTNAQRLGHEIGDTECVTERLLGTLNQKDITFGYANKISQLDKYLQKRGS